MVNPADPFGLVGQVLDGQLRVEGMVGEGGFSVVYRGQHLGLNEPVAIKCLKLPASLDSPLVESFVQKFRDESRILYRLSQGNLHIVRSLAAGTTRAAVSGALVPYMALEWLEGRSLASDFDDRRGRGAGRALHEVVSLFETAADALAFAHAQGVVHRDLNPGNLFVVEAGSGPKLKVLDFGVAKLMHDGALNLGPRAPTIGAIRIFSPAYGAPEQFDNDLGPVSAASDVYALALILLEAMRDREVNEGDNLADFARLAVDPARRPTPRMLGLDVSAEVEAAFERATRLSPSERWPTAGAFWESFSAAARAPAARPSAAMPAPFAATMPLGSGPSPGGPAPPDAIEESEGEDVTRVRAPEPNMLQTLALADAPPRPAAAQAPPARPPAVPPFEGAQFDVGPFDVAPAPAPPAPAPAPAPAFAPAPAPAFAPAPAPAFAPGPGPGPAPAFAPAPAAAPAPPAAPPPPSKIGKGPLIGILAVLGALAVVGASLGVYAVTRRSSQAPPAPSASADLIPVPMPLPSPTPSAPPAVAPPSTAPPVIAATDGEPDAGVDASTAEASPDATETATEPGAAEPAGPTRVARGWRPAPVPVAVEPEEETPDDPYAWRESVARSKLNQANGVLVFCRRADGVTGPGTANVTFGNDGKVSRVVLDAPYADTKEGACVAGQFRRVKVSAFAGAPQTVRHKFEIPKKK